MTDPANPRRVRPLDLIVRGARTVAGPERVDIGVRDGRIIEMGARIDSTAIATYDARGEHLIVTAGLIDLHAHVAVGLEAESGTLQCAPPDAVGISSGVTTLVDAGSLGPRDFHRLEHEVAGSVATRVLGFMNVSMQAHRAPDGGDFVTAEDLDPDRITEAARSGTVSGLKLRLLGEVAQRCGHELVDSAKESAARLGLPLMVHIGDRHTSRGPSAAAGLSTALRIALSTLEAGDVLTHICSPWPGAVSRTPEAIGELTAARDRGVIFDAGMGRNHFDVDLARLLRSEGVGPQTISTDMNMPGSRGHSLTEDMSKMLAVGYSLSEVIEMATGAPARVLGRSDLGRLEVGFAADLTVLEIVSGDFEFDDAKGQRFSGDTGLIPRATVRAGTLHPVSDGPHDGDWLTHFSDTTISRSS